MSVRRIVYPDEYGAKVVGGGDICLRFRVPGSKFGPVEIILVADDAGSLAGELDKALYKSMEMLAAASAPSEEAR